MFGLAQGIGSFLGDFNDESGKIRAANDKKAADEAAIEQKALDHLATSDDPHIKAAAVTAMLTPKKGSGGSGLSKWFGQQRDHPVFDQVKQLMAGGAEPFLSEEEKAAQHRSGTILGASRGASQGMREEGIEPTPEFTQRVIEGATGTPQKSAAPKPVTLEVDDPNNPGQTMHIGGIEVGGQYYDQNYSPITQTIHNVFTSGSATPHTPTNPNPGGQHTTVPDKNSSTGYSSVTWDKDGRELHRVPTAPPLAPPNAIFQGPTGFLGAAPGRGVNEPPRIIDVQNSPAVTHTEAPSVNFNSLMEIHKGIVAQANKPRFPGGPTPPPAQVAQRLDALAKEAKFASWDDLNTQIAAAQRAVGGAVQGSGAPPAPIAGSPTQPAAPAGRTPAASTKPGAAPKKGAKASVPDLSIDQIIELLDKHQ